MDKLLFTTKSKRPTVFWHPGEGRSIVPSKTTYQRFTHIVRTLHINEAIDVCESHRMKPRHIGSYSSISRKSPRHANPCYDLQVLWFGTRVSDADESQHDWYGNVEFALPADFLVKHWKNWYFVEMVSAPTHTVTRLLVTNSDYSSVLQAYDPRRQGQQWVCTRAGHFSLSDCLRYNNVGYNKHGHRLEFMLEVTPHGQKKVLEECEISFKNHSEARDASKPHVCYRYQRGVEQCPWPVSSPLCARIFFYIHQQRWQYSSPLATPRLSSSAELLRQRYYDMVNASLDPERPLPPAQLQPMPSLPLPTTSFLFTNFVLYSDFGMFSSRSFVDLSGLITGPEHVRHIRNWQYMPWNILLQHLCDQTQTQSNDDESQSQFPALNEVNRNGQLNELSRMNFHV